MNEKYLALHAHQKLASPGTHDRVSRHQLRMRETFVNVFVDDVRLEQNQIALDQTPARGCAG
jgi:hypothetical protein